MGVSGCWSLVSGASHPPPSTSPASGPCLAWGRSLPCSPLQKPRVPSKHLGWLHGTKHQSHWAQCRDGLFTTLWTIQTWNLLKASRCLIYPGVQSSMEKSRWFGGGIWTAQLQNPCKADSIPSKSGITGSSTAKGRHYTPQGWWLCSGISEKWMISSNACTWGSATSAHRIEPVPPNLRGTAGHGRDPAHPPPMSEAMPKHELWNTSTGVTVRTSVLCLPPPNTASVHSFHHFHWGELSLILTTAAQTFTLTDERFQTARTV